MCAKVVRQLPSFVVRARTRLGMSQQALSKKTGVLQTTICALERGRRVNPGKAFREALRQGLELSDTDEIAMNMAIEHDRIVCEVERGPCNDAAELVSAVLLAADRLSGPERNGLLRRIQWVMRVKEEHQALIDEPPLDDEAEGLGEAR